MRHALIEVTAKALNALVAQGHQPNCACPRELFSPHKDGETSLRVATHYRTALSIMECSKFARCEASGAARISLAGLFRRAASAAARTRPR